MKLLTKTVILLSIITVNSIGHAIAQDNPEAIITRNNLIDRINEIKNIPYKNLGIFRLKVDSIAANCGDSLYWEIVRLQKEAIPCLIQKVKDTTTTNIIIPCRSINLRVGTIAFMVLDDIIPINYRLVSGTQWDVYQTNCDFGYPTRFLEYINKHSHEIYDKLTKWYDKYGQKFEKQTLSPAAQSDCQKKFGINCELTIKY